MKLDGVQGFDPEVSPADAPSSDGLGTECDFLHENVAFPISEQALLHLG